MQSQLNSFWVHSFNYRHRMFLFLIWKYYVNLAWQMCEKKLFNEVYREVVMGHIINVTP
jgi:hypothetical protein